MVCQFIDTASVAAALDYPSLVGKIRETLRHDVIAPLRQTIQVRENDLLLVMPAARPDGDWIVKTVSIIPGNAAIGLSTVPAIVTLFNGQTGQMRAVLDGTTITRRRTAAVSALACSYLATKEASRLTVVGTGAQAGQMAAAHAAVRPIRQIRVWGRSADKAVRMAAQLESALPGCEIEPVSHLAEAVNWANIVTVATLAREPIVKGAWLRPGSHLDLVGAHSPLTREADDEAITKSSAYVDFDSAFCEAGEIMIPLRTGLIDRAHVKGDLRGLVRGLCHGRRSNEEITVFKAVGNAVGDLAAAELVWARVQSRSG